MVTRRFKACIAFTLIGDCAYRSKVLLLGSGGKLFLFGDLLSQLFDHFSSSFRCVGPF